MSETIKTLFTNISPEYDRLNHLLSLNIDKIWRRKAINLIQKASLPQTPKILDLCAGTYDLSLECLKQLPNAHVTASDFSQGMLDAGRSKIGEPLSKGQITPVCADALNMPFEDESFDVAVCAYGIRNLDDTQKGLQEIKRVLKPGGQLIVLEFFKPQTLLSTAFHKTYARFVIPLIGKWVSGHNSAYAYLRDSITGFVTTDEFKDLLEKESFKDSMHKDFLLSISTAFWSQKP